MAWTPSETELAEIDELLVFTNFSQVFTFQGEAGTNYSVTGIVADRTNDLMTVGTNSISGQYNGTPHGGLSIFYLKKDGTYATANDFGAIGDAYEICSYTAPSTRYVTYNYTVTAEDANNIGEVVTQTYSVVASFNWDAGKTALVAAIALTRIGRD
jgi:hypothetical protein